jgi:hypothetical protein
MRGTGDLNVAQPDNDDFNLSDLGFSNVGMKPLTDFTEMEPLEGAMPVNPVEVSPLSASEAVSPLDKKEAKAEKKLAKEKKVKEKKAGKAKAAPGEKKAMPAIFQRLRRSSPYTVLLGIALAALLLGVLFWVVELGRYGYDLKAQGKKGFSLNASAAVSTSVCLVLPGNDFALQTSHPVVL